jgi:Protein of unknown function (DUF3572)
MQKLNPIRGDAAQLALQALVWALSDDARSDRLMALTGLTPDALRAGIAEPGMQAAILAYLENYEADLIACAADIGASPADLVAARRELDGGNSNEDFY